MSNVVLIEEVVREDYRPRGGEGMTERSRYRYVCAGQVCYPVSTTREEAEKIAVEYTHDEAENDIKKHFRYVSFNSERNPEVNSKGEKL